MNSRKAISKKTINKHLLVNSLKTKIDIGEKRIYKLKGRSEENMQTEALIVKKMKNIEKKIRDLSDMMKRIQTSII